MLLAIDCGNTHMVIGVYDGSALKHCWRLSTDRNKTEDEYMVLLDNLLRVEGGRISEIHAMAIGSVVPAITNILSRLAAKYLKLTPLVVSHTTNTGMPILLDNPTEVGPDRVINGVAAYQQYGGPLIVVDFGTATTFDCISAQGEYLGGAIAPGIETSANALVAKAARLSSVSLESPTKVIGKNTADSLRSGIFWGFAGQVDGIVEGMERELGEKVNVIGTGGLAAMVSTHCRTMQIVDVNLTLDGLRLIYERNK